MTENNKEKNKDPFELPPVIEGALRPAPKFADRISKRVIGVSFGLVTLVAIIFLLSLDQMDNKKTPVTKPVIDNPVVDKNDKTVPEEFKDKSASAGGGGVKNDKKSVTSVTLALDGSQNGGVSFPGGSQKKASEPVASVVPAMSGVNGGTIPNPKDRSSPPVGVVVAPLTPEQQAAVLEKQARQTRMTQSRATGLLGKTFNASDAAVSGSGAPAGLAEMLAAAGKSGAGNGGNNSFQAGTNASKVDNEQDEKLDFVKNASKEERAYHPHVPLPALSKNEIKTGSFIPMTLETSINSDLPGQITARVTEDVYDSITGCRLLIPAMAKVVGKYDSKVALGQGRMLVVWNALIFPDGAELNLAGMQGYDTSGQSGLESDVDNHYWRMFGLTFGLSMITAGVQLSVPPPTPSVNGAVPQQSAEQVISTALAQQFGNLGAQILGKYMAVQPTLRNFAGERFVVMVPRTLVLPKIWRNRCKAS